MSPAFFMATTASAAVRMAVDLIEVTAPPAKTAMVSASKLTYSGICAIAYTVLSPTAK